ncbi:MAG: BlaI/MecI/CopY family transcriptional regulator [Lachnospiraceae bacterium]|nr:BlaI/MecI/CopY family transcriptional regulator [Lachnospiraceae bacterium]
MEKYKLGEMEEKFADLIWELAPIASGELAKRCEAEFGWKRTTTYTMLKRLCLRDLFANENGTVVVRTAKEDFQAVQGEQFLEEHFDGSLPLFLTAFSRRRKLSGSEVEEMRKLIDAYEEGEDD